MKMKMTDVKIADLKPVYVLPDGTVCANKAEALNVLRRPQIKAALEELAQDNSELVEYLLNNQELIESAFEAGTIKRVTKSEKSKLTKALEAVVATKDPAFEFIAANADAILDSFRWPSVKRMDEAEKIEAARIMIFEDSKNEDVAGWVIDNRLEILEAFKAGIVKREVSEKAKNGLAAYREKKKAEKEAAAK
jgi:predicted RNA-binding protein YlxR (DUF448 family)